MSFFVVFFCLSGAVCVGVTAWMDVSADKKQQHHTGVRLGSL